MKTYKATKNGETLKYLIPEGISSSQTMQNIKNACMFLERDLSAISVETDEGWKVERM